MMSVLRIPGSCSAPNTTVPPAFADWLLAEPVPATINAANTAPARSQSLYRCIDPSKGRCERRAPATALPLATNAVRARWFVTSSYARSHRAYPACCDGKKRTDKQSSGTTACRNEQRDAGRSVGRNVQRSIIVAHEGRARQRRIALLRLGGLMHHSIQGSARKLTKT